MANNFNFPPHAPVPAVAPVIFHNRIVDGNRLCSMVGFLLVPSKRRNRLSGLKSVPNEFFFPDTQNRQLQAASLGVFDRQTCNAVDNPAIRGSVFDQHICVGGIAQTAINCNVRNERDLWRDESFKLLLLNISSSTTEPLIIAMESWSVWGPSAWCATLSIAPEL